MIHEFAIRRVVPASLSNVIANHLDPEHVPSIHPFLRNWSVISETDLALCGSIETRILGLWVRQVHYLEFRPPGCIFQAVHSPVGLITVTSRFEELRQGTSEACCDGLYEFRLELASPYFPFRRWIERRVRAAHDVIYSQDLPLLTRRQKLFGGWIEDYLREGQYLLFKEAFRRHFSTSSAPRPAPGALANRM